jgi:hypothetical protein
VISDKEYRLEYYPSPGSMTGKMYSTDILLKKKYAQVGVQTAVAYPYKVIGGVPPGAGLAELLSFYTKENCMQIIDAAGINIKKAVKKEVMLGLLGEQIPESFGRFITLMDERMYQTIQEFSAQRVFPLTQAFGLVPYVAHLIQRGYVYRLSIVGKEFLYLPPELGKILDGVDKADLKEMVKYNSILLKIGKNILYYYGVVKEYLYLSLLEELVYYFDQGNLHQSTSPSTINWGLNKGNWARKIEIEAIANVIIAYATEINKVYLGFPTNGWYYAHPNVADPCNILFEQESQGDVDFLPLSVNDLLADRHLDQKTIRQMTKYIADRLHISYLDAVGVANDWVLRLKNGDDLIVYASCLDDRRAPGDAVNFNSTLELAMARFFKHINQWALKGHSIKSCF